MGLVAPHVGSSHIRDWTHVFGMDKWIPYHWDTKETSYSILGFPSGSAVQNVPANAGDYKGQGFDPWDGKKPWSMNWQPKFQYSLGFPGSSNGKESAKSLTHTHTHTHTHQYSCLEHFMDREAWKAVIHRVAKSWAHDWATKHHTCTYIHIVIPV